MVGSNFPYGEFLPKEGQARGVQIDIKGESLGLRYPMEVNLAGDAAETLRALLPLLEHKTDTAWREAIAEEPRTTVHASRRRERRSPPNPLNPELVFSELSPRLPDGCILSGDAGTADQLARAASQDAPRHEVLALGQPRNDGPRRAVCDRGEIRVPRPRRDRADRRRRDADERHQRVDHDPEVLEVVERPTLDRAGR